MPLTVRKELICSWEEQRIAFEKFNTTISIKLLLKLPNFDAPFKVHMNVLSKEVGKVLVQEGHPMVFES